ncbi:MAG: hypothetical protein AB7F76_10525 [Parvibaculaceae bacterium]
MAANTTPAIAAKALMARWMFENRLALSEVGASRMQCPLAWLFLETQRMILPSPPVRPSGARPHLTGICGNSKIAGTLNPLVLVGKSLISLNNRQPFLTFPAINGE